MQIQPPNSLAGAASSGAQAATKSSESASANASAQVVTGADVEQSQGANEDRDAQGQGDGLVPRDEAKDARAQDDSPSVKAPGDRLSPAVLPGETPPRLDVLG